MIWAKFRLFMQRYWLWVALVLLGQVEDDEVSGLVIGGHLSLVVGHAQTVSHAQLDALVEMDGIVDSAAHVVVMAAMNAAEDVLDPALLRPGRFDRKLQITRPNLEEREQIFAYYGKNIKLDRDIDYAR
ncbi:AAA family ATPase, partial [Elusimicrobiota bacterium]